MTDAYIREGISLANSRWEQEERIRKAKEYSASCEASYEMWENLGKVIAIVVTVGAWAAIFAHLV